MIYRTLVAAAIIVLAAGPASAQLFSLINQSVSNITGTGARAHGMGGAFIALADDATAASWNPAGLAQLNRPEMSVVYEDFSGNYNTNQLVVEDYTNFEPFPFSFRSTIDSPGEFESSNLAFVSATYPFRIGKTPLVTQASYRRMASFPNLKRAGGTLSQLLDGDGNPLDQFETAISSDDQFQGGFDAYTISIATQLGGKVRLGLSANYIDIDIRNQYQSVEVEVDDPTQCWRCSSIDGQESFSDWNFDLGIQWQPIRALTFGAVYHSAFSTDYKYSVTNQRSYYDPRSGGVVELVPSTSSGDTTVHYPDGWGAGLAWRATDRLTFAVD